MLKVLFHDHTVFRHLYVHLECGNDQCEDGEDCSICPKDCGMCPLKVWHYGLIGSAVAIFVFAIIGIYGVSIDYIDNFQWQNYISALWQQLI